MEKKEPKKSTLHRKSSCVGLPSRGVFSGGVKNSARFKKNLLAGLRHLPLFFR
jgi:hypothetical protein